MGYQFFLSYARVPGQSTDVGEFFDALAQEVRTQVGRDAGEAGFIDRNMELGVDWRETIATALRTCKSMICLLSEDYVDSDYCGREFTAWSRRLKALGIEAETSDLIIPVRWTVIRRQLPAVLGSLQHDNSGFPPEYEQFGLQRLKSLRQYHDQYLQCIYKLADTIMAETRRRIITDAVDILPLSQTANAFRPTQPVTPQLGPLGPRNPKFVYIAAQPDELPASKSQRAAYDDGGGWFWSPYVPNEDKSVGQVAHDAAITLRMQPGDLPTSQELAANLQVAIKNNTPVAIVVDPWTLTLGRYDRFVRDVCQLLSEVERDYGAFIAWNEADVDTAMQQAMLKAQIDVTFRDHRPAEFYFPTITSLPDLRDRIVDYLRGMRRKIMERNPIRGIDPGPAAPTLAVPGGEPR